MTALTADRNTHMKPTELIVGPVAAGAKIYAGAMACANAAGLIVPGAVAANLTYLGRAEERADNTGGADGAKSALIRRRNAFKWANGAVDPVTQAEMGKVVYILDDQTVVKTNGTNTRSAAGRVVGIDADGVWIE